MVLEVVFEQTNSETTVDFGQTTEVVPGDAPIYFAPVAKVDQLQDGALLTIQDKNGTTTAKVKNGTDGYSPTAKVERTETGVLISITDKNGTTTEEVKDSQNGEGGTVDLTGYATEQWVKNGYQPKGNYALKSEIPSVPVQSVNGKTGAVQLGAADVSADPAGTAAAAVSQHNTAEDAHSDIRLELQAINNRLTAFFDSDDQTLDELSEIVAYITSNKTLIEAITTSKVSVTDIVNNLTSSVANKPLSAAQGVVLKGLIDGVDAKFSSYALASAIPTKVSQLQNDEGYLLEADGVLMYTEQTPTEAQQTQARANLGFVTDGDHRDIFVDWYGIRRGSADYAQRNSEIMARLAPTLQNGFTLHFGSGHYYFAEPIPHLSKHISFKGVCTNAAVSVEDVNYGTFLHFPNLANGEAAISVDGGVVQDLGIVGNPSVCKVTIDRTKSITNKNGVVNLVDNGTTYGIKVGSWGYTIQNVRVRHCTYGIYTETSNALITNADLHHCKVGVSIGNDTKVNNVQVRNVMVGVQLRGQLASATNIRGDSIGKHLVECWEGKCILSNIDGDYCVGSLIHYGDGTKKYMHLGQAVACMGRVATRTSFSRDSSFDLRNVSESDYEYCSYISIAPYTQVFGGHIELSNVKANIMDAASEYVHPDAPISIGTGSTVKGVTIKCNVPYDVNVDYFNKQVIKNLSTNAEAENSETEYVTDFDGRTVEDINFITPIGFIRSKRTLGALDRVLEFSKDANAAVLYWKQNLTEPEKAQARANLGLDNISSLEFVASVESCTDSTKTYVLPDGRTVAYAEKPSYTNRLPLAVDSTGAIYNAGTTPGYRDGSYFDGSHNEQPSTNWDVTGFIPVKTGDIVRLKNLRFLETDVNVIPAANTRVRIDFYKSDFSWTVSSSNYSPTSLPSAAWSAVYDETGNVVQFTVPTAYSANGIAYMRMCVRSITPDSIITVNEEIKPPTASFGETGLRFVTEATYKKIEALLAQ